MRKRTFAVGAAVLLVVLAVAAVALRGPLWRKGMAALQLIKGRRTADERVAEVGNAVHERLAPDFDRLSVSYPPDRVVLVGLKQERRLEVWVAEDKSPFVLLRSYPILAASGTLGPKLRQGDRQVPEGVYRVESLNPNSMFHLALRVGYPNDFDRAKGAADGRTDLGGDIMIHGSNVSVGCLAMGDEAAEDLFVLAAETGIENVTVILSPVDFRTTALPADMPDVPAWAPELYDVIRAQLRALKRAEP